MKVKIGAFLGGGLFGVGLALSGMTQPAKIVGFFEFVGGWDPSLGFVMLGALAVYAPGYRWVVGKWERPVWAPVFCLPTRKDLDVRLIGGSVLFGIGWGLAGYCPGPAFTAIGAGSSKALIVGVFMLLGMGLYRLVSAPRSSRPGEASTETAITDG